MLAVGGAALTNVNNNIKDSAFDTAVPVSTE